MEAETPLLENMASPFIFDSNQSSSEKIPLIKENPHFPEGAHPIWMSL
jgi:hypothetical protein